MHATRNNRFRSKLDGFRAAQPVWCCMSCRTRHDAPLLAQCTHCKKTTKAMQSVPGLKRNTNCPNCAQPKLKNKRVEPLLCLKCGREEFLYFHSTSEFKVFAELAMLQDHGKITELQTQVKFPIIYKGDKKPLTTYIADMVFYKVGDDGQRRRHVVDVKGDEKAVDALFKLKKKLVEKHYPGTTIEVITARN